MTSNKNRKVGIIAVALTAGAIAVLFLAAKYNRYAVAKRYKESEVTFKHQLASGNFTPIDATNFNITLREIVELNLDSPKNAALSSRQRGALVERVGALYKAFHEGTFDAYARFRYPADLQRSNAFEKFYITHLRVQAAQLWKTAQKKDSKSEEMLVLPANLTVRQVLETNYYLWCAAGTSWTNPLFCRTAWREADLSKTGIDVLKATNNIGKLQDVMTSTNYLGARFSPVNGFVHPTPQEVIKRQGDVLTAYVSLVVKTEHPPEIVPIVVQFYWVDEYGEWLPYQFANGYAMSKLHHLFDL